MGNARPHSRLAKRRPEDQKAHQTGDQASQIVALPQRRVDEAVHLLVPPLHRRPDCLHAGELQHPQDRLRQDIEAGDAEQQNADDGPPPERFRSAV